MILREFAKIGKYMLRELSNAVSIYEEVEKELSTNEGSDVEESIPSFAIQKIRLSKTQIIQYMYYHFFSVDERGVVVVPSEKEIAKAIGCTVRTVRNNNLTLEEAGLIYCSHSGSRLNVWLLRYPDYFQEGGSGYLELQFNRFQEFANIENVNALRIELRLELIYDNNEVKRQLGKDDTAKITKNDLKMFLPKYTHYTGALEKIVSKCTNAFEKAISDISILFTKKQDYIHAKEAKKIRQLEYKKQIEDRIHEVTGTFSPSDVRDFVQMCFEYGGERVLMALNSLIELICYSTERIEHIHNHGGMLRTIIRIQLEQNGQEKVPMAV